MEIPQLLITTINLKHVRGIIEPSFGIISRMLPRKIHVITLGGFELKVLCLIVILQQLLF